MSGGADRTAGRRILPESRIDDLGEAILALTREIWVLTDRQAVLEAVLGQAGIDTGSIDRYQPDAAMTARLADRRQQLIDNILFALKAK
ncbi:hypothetical protein [Sphingomonas bacterium]|uniref:hypothetical protein n=1 Tax=Sphingomonas bacterium TaxID=1895847 RepID=UPI00157511EB|nr:hypothetical protein [Sphingomonas bacterium]